MSIISDYGGSNTPPEHRDSWRTPPEVFEPFNAEYRFVGDVAASSLNALHSRYLTEEQNALDTNWLEYFGSGTVWCNPPYSDISPWVEKANNEVTNGVGTVMLLPADTSVGWFKMARTACTEVRFIVGGRLAFINAATGKPVSGNNKGSLLIIWNPYQPAAGHSGYIDRDSLLAKGRTLLSHKASLAA
jgi:phage N-6-adenine-methyltransferase